MSENVKERLKELRSQLHVITRKILTHPQVELTYNRWLQYPYQERRILALASLAVFFLVVATPLIIGTNRLVKNQLSIWRAQTLIEAIESYQLEETQLKNQIKSYSDSGGLFTGKVEDIITPLHTKLFLPPGSVQYQPLPADPKSALRAQSTRVTLARLTLKQAVEVLFSIENAGANVSVKDYSMTAIPNERGWFKVQFQVNVNLPEAPSGNE